MSEYKPEKGSSLDVAQQEEKAAATAVDEIQAVIDGLERERAAAQSVIDSTDWQNLEDLRAAFAGLPAIDAVLDAARKESERRQGLLQAASLRLEHVTNPLIDSEKEVKRYSQDLRRAKALADIGEKQIDIPRIETQLKNARENLKTARARLLTVS